jgi:hypothetical protein
LTTEYLFEYKTDDGLFEGLRKEFCSDRSVKAILKGVEEKAKAYITEKGGTISRDVWITWTTAICEIGEMIRKWCNYVPF